MNNEYWQNGELYTPVLFSPPYSTMGRVITGRSVPGESVRPLNMQNQISQTRLYQNRQVAIKRLEGPDWGMFLGGAFVGGFIALLLATSMGRKILCATGRRVEKRIRG